MKNEVIQMEIANFLSSVKKQALQEVDVKSLILVGSYARGQEKDESDVDLVIIS